MMKATRKSWLAIAAATVFLLGGCASAPAEDKKADMSSLFANNAGSMEDTVSEGYAGCWKYQEERYLYLSTEKEWKESDGETVTAEGQYDIEDGKALLYDEAGALYRTLTLEGDTLLDQDGGELAYYSESLEGLVPYFLLYHIERNYTAGDDPAVIDNGAAQYKEDGAYQPLPAYGSVKVTDVREEGDWREMDFVVAEEIHASDLPTADTSVKYLTACGLYDYYTGGRFGMNMSDDVLQSSTYWTITFREASYDIQITYQYEWKAPSGKDSAIAYRRYTVKMPLSYDGLVVILHPLDTYAEYQDGDMGFNGIDLDKLGDRLQKSIICRL